MDQLDGVLGPYAVAAAAAAAVAAVAAAAEAEAEVEAGTEPVGVVAAEVPRLVAAVWQSLQCCQLAVPACCGEQ